MARVAQLHNNKDKTRYYTLRRENVLGRSPECAPLFFDNKRVSRRHAKIAAPAGSDAFYIEDISTRGIYVNFHRVKGRHPLQPGDRICILQFRNIHPLDLERMTDEDVRECCDDPRNKMVRAIVDLTFMYAEVEDCGPAGHSDQPTGLLGKIKFLLGR
ncbi:MAG: FHA domain-containing protein [Planctomycetota bacterium]